MKLINGREIAENIISDLEKKIKKEKIKAGLGVVLVGRDPASCLYVRLKEKAAKRVGVAFFKHQLPEESSTEEVAKVVKRLNDDSSVSGILIQFPLPDHIDKDEVVSIIDPRKDIDGFLPTSRFDSPFVAAIWEALESTREKLDGKKAAVLVNSDILGKELVDFLSARNLEATYSKDRGNDRTILADAAIIITALGKPEYIKGEMILDGAIVIDGGISKQDGLIAGDVDRESVEKKASWLSSVPGGVGPITVAMVLKNVVLAANSFLN